MVSFWASELACIAAHSKPVTGGYEPCGIWGDSVRQPRADSVQFGIVVLGLVWFNVFFNILFGPRFGSVPKNMVRSTSTAGLRATKMEIRGMGATAALLLATLFWPKIKKIKVGYLGRFQHQKQETLTNIRLKKKVSGQFQ